jgi:1-hydroxycarotenoid 3,4-desaturase
MSRNPTPTPASTPRVVVVGGGIGGLVAAALLARQGLEVTLVEAASGPGGKMRGAQVGGRMFDTGPTVFTMRWVFDQLCDELGLRFDELVTLEPLELLARHCWREAGGGSSGPLDLHADGERSAAEIAGFAGAAEARRFRSFCAEARSVYRRLEGPHIRASRPSFGQMVGALGPGGLIELTRLGPFASLWKTLGRHFRDPRLRQLFGRYATYCGASPWQAPATLMLVAHVEMAGVWSVGGGMRALAAALAAAGERLGVRPRYGAVCEEIVVERGEVAGVRLAGGERLAADAVVFNGDVGALAGGLLGSACASVVPSAPEPVGRSLSALTWCAAAPTEGLALARHNVFFDTDYASEFADAMQRRRLPRRGTVYLCAQDRGAALGPPADGAGSAERLLALVNAPADGGDGRPLAAAPEGAAFTPEELAACEKRSLDLMAHCGLRLSWPQAATLRRSPLQFAAQYPGSHGALYGPATHGWMALFRRAGAATALPGLYLAGGSVHPGPGVPMAAMSGRLAAATLMAHLGSTLRSSRVAISGGTSMRSPTTAAMPSP